MLMAGKSTIYEAMLNLYLSLFCHYKCEAQRYERDEKYIKTREIDWISCKGVN